MKKIACRCWCYGIKDMVYVVGELVGKRQADLLLVKDCERKNCPKRGEVDCLISRLREGRFTY